MDFEGFKYIKVKNQKMKHTYKITGMTCSGCSKSVSESLVKVPGVSNVLVNLEQGEAEITMDSHVASENLRAALPTKYGLHEKTNIESSMAMGKGLERSKLKQLKPLLLIFLYLFSSAFLLNFKEWNTHEAMLDFMGLFYIVFSFFKLLDLKGFVVSFRMYDPLAKVFPAYSWIYPFIEMALGLLFLMRLEITMALIATIIILGITTIGVTRILLDKKSIQCACLGTALKLPMTEATFIENAIMIIMAIIMLGQNL